MRGRSSISKSTNCSVRLVGRLPTAAQSLRVAALEGLAIADTPESRTLLAQELQKASDPSSISPEIAIAQITSATTGLGL